MIHDETGYFKRLVLKKVKRYLFQEKFFIYLYRRNVLIIGSAVLMTIVALAFRDYDRVVPDQRIWFIGGKVIFGLLAAYGLVLGYRDRAHFGTLCFLWAVHLAHIIHGQYFVIHYYVGYLLGVLVAAFLIPGTPMAMLLLMGGGMVAFLGALFIWPSPMLATEPPWFLGDIVLTVCIANLLGLGGYYLVFRERRQKEETYRRFADIGRSSAMLLHDIKNLIMAPGMSASLLKRKLQDHPVMREDPLVSKLVDSMVADMGRVCQFIFEMEKMTVGPSPEKDKELSTISLHELVTGVQILIGARIGACRIESIGDAVYCIRKRYLMRALMNVIMNSLDALSRTRENSGVIVVKAVGHSIVISDEAGGFPQAVLNKIRSGLPVSDKENGSGLGVMIIKDYMEALGGVAHFANSSKGAVVTLSLPESSVKSYS